jgi:hypothetical protein
MIHRITISQTADLAASSSHKERFIAEYIQLKQRYEKLKAFNTKIEAAARTRQMDNGVDEPEHDCPAVLLREQQAAMGEYLHILEVRAVIEDVDLRAAIRSLHDYNEACVREALRVSVESEEKMPDDVLTFDKTLEALERCDMFVDGYDGSCAKCPCVDKRTGECGNMAPLIKSCLYYFKKYVNP